MCSLFVSVCVSLFFCTAYCSSVLFDKHTGILVFLKDSVSLDEVYIIQLRAYTHVILCICDYDNVCRLVQRKLCTSFDSQFTNAQEELLRLLNDYTRILENRALPYALDIKVPHPPTPSQHTHTHTHTLISSWLLYFKAQVLKLSFSLSLSLTQHRMCVPAYSLVQKPAK